MLSTVLTFRLWVFGVHTYCMWLMGCFQTYTMCSTLTTRVANIHIYLSVSSFTDSSVSWQLFLPPSYTDCNVESSLLSPKIGQKNAKLLNIIKINSASQIAPYSLDRALPWTKALWAQVKSSALLHIGFTVPFERQPKSESHTQIVLLSVVSE